MTATFAEIDERIPNATTETGNAPTALYTSHEMRRGSAAHPMFQARVCITTSFAYGGFLFQDPSQ